MSYKECACVGGCENCEQLDFSAVIGDAVRFERERIIKLLEAMRCGCGSTECPHIVDAITLIKGENK